MQAYLGVSCIWGYPFVCYESEQIKTLQLPNCQPQTFTLYCMWFLNDKSRIWFGRSSARLPVHASSSAAHKSCSVFLCVL